MDALRSIEPTHRDRVALRAIEAPAVEIKAKAQAYGLTESHGLVGIDGAGKVVVRLEGHKFGATPETAREAIEGAIRELLSHEAGDFDNK